VAFTAGVQLWNRWSLPSITSIAVLPFENPAGDSDLDYICNGMTDGLIEHLSRASSLKVIERATVNRFRGEKDPMKAAEALRVGAVVMARWCETEPRLLFPARCLTVQPENASRNGNSTGWRPIS
jgi:TolB-like protein